MKDSIILKSMALYIPTMGLIWGIVYLSGYFVELADTAYFDIFRSYTLPYMAYVLCLIVRKIYRKYCIKKVYVSGENKNRDKEHGGSERDKKVSVDIGANKAIRSYRVTLKNCFSRLLSNDYIVIEIGKLFTLITVVNNIMMVSGIDTPKVGRFAYAHLLMRLFIVTIISVGIGLFEGNTILKEMSKIVTNLAAIKALPIKRRGRVIRDAMAKDKYGTVCVVFTGVTVSTCIVALMVVPAPVGGVGLYGGLLGVFVSAVLGGFILSKF